MLYDVFICHASEDKDEFVRPLAKKLRGSHLEVWYDEFSLTVGDSLRESIDRGLAKSRYGIVVLSPYFFDKKWPKRELNGLVAREMYEPHDVILPIWHNISHADVIKFSPPLADRQAISSKKGLSFVCRELIRKLRPKESPLIIARDELIQFGLTPPVITDEWWLDVIEASNRIPDGGYIPPENTCWGRWTFPLPEKESDGTSRGKRLAWTALQMQWEEKADEQRITQITRPDIVHQFIHSQPGLSEACHDYPDRLATYAPQLTIKGFSGEFERDFDDLLKTSIKKCTRYFSGASLLTVTQRSPLCDEFIALRHPSFGDYEASSIACQFVQGDMGGPHSRFYEHFEYNIWLLSAESAWLPQRIRDYLIKGMKEWNVWWHNIHNEEYEVQITPFYEALFKAKNFKSFKLSNKVRRSLQNWIEISLQNLNVVDNSEEIVEKFVQLGFIETFFQDRRQMRNKRK